MIVPQYWAEGRLQHRSGGKQVTVRRFGWSDDSQEEAQAHADARVREALERILAGEKLPRRDFKQPYNGADGLPIREEIIARHGDSIITRNSYGALCLNTPSALFVDIDLHDPGPSVALKRKTRVPLLVVALVVGVASKSWVVGVIALAAALLMAGWMARRLHRAQLQKDGGPEARANERIEAFMAIHPDWSLRQYRTPAGFRLLAMHRAFDAREPEVEACFNALQTDPLYALMCVRQHCFRARVSPKPWRIGVSQHLRPRPGVWPIKPERVPDRQRWVADYERLSMGFASCSYMRSLGGGAIDPDIEQVRVLHDGLSQAERVLPLG